MIAHGIFSVHLTPVAGVLVMQVEYKTASNGLRLYPMKVYHTNG